jgi:hypothetical protein
MRKKIIQVAAGLAVAMPLAAFAMTSAGGGAALGNVAAAGYGQQKVTICHNGQTISVAQSAVPAHQSHGDTLGACPA